MKKKILFRADGNAEIGMGHFMRLIALADMIKNDFEAIFVTTSPSPFQIKEINKVCSKLIELPKATHFDTFLNHLNGDEIVVLDNYYFDINYQRKVKQQGCSLVCIDDFASNSYCSDIVINHSPLFPEELIDCDNQTKLLTGSDYAILRQSFLASNRTFNTNELTKVFICFGGVDHDNYTLYSLKKIAENPFQKINIIVGGAYKWKNELKLFIDTVNHIDIQVHTNIPSDKMIEIMELSQLAVTSAGIIASETGTVNMGLFVKQTVDNQEYVYNGLLKSGAASDLDSFNFDTLSNDVSKHVAAQKKLYDKQSTKRFIKVFNEL